MIPQRPSKPPPAGPAPLAPAAAPPNPPASAGSAATVNGAKPASAPNGTSKAKKGTAKQETSVDPQAMYESLKNKIAALEEELNHADEEELKIGAYFMLLKRVLTHAGS